MLTAPDARIQPLIDREYTQTIAREFVTGHGSRARRSRYGLYQQVYMLWSLERWLQEWDPAL